MYEKEHKKILNFTLFAILIALSMIILFSILH